MTKRRTARTIYSSRRCETCPAITCDGQQVDLFGNIEFPHEVRHCLSRGAGGVGLYRTEFLYLGTDTPPDEEGHFQAYSSVVRAMGDRPVIIRTFDLGADKVQSQVAIEEERIPFSACAARGWPCATCRSFARNCARFCGPAR